MDTITEANVDTNANADAAEPLPQRSARSQRTFDALVAAATELFRQRGFSEVTISEISRQAGMSHGTFYTHFDSKEEILRAVVDAINETALHRSGRGRQPGASLIERIDETNRSFFEDYRSNARILASYEELAGRDDATATMRRRTRHDYIERTTTSIRAWQAGGLVDAEVDPDAIAHCLGSMVERVAHMRFVFGDGVEDDRLLDAIRHVWAASLGLDSTAGQVAESP